MHGRKSAALTCIKLHFRTAPIIARMSDRMVYIIFGAAKLILIAAVVALVLRLVGR